MVAMLPPAPASDLAPMCAGVQCGACVAIFRASCAAFKVIRQYGTGWQMPPPYHARIMLKERCWMGNGE